ncbi:insulinase family protein [Sorangium sp. So ce131]|uniref:M16 family metallopeptidase n=1 Tax=Sorangium sp. So ce131 TaxID=3133282 RepID=UPI003F5DF2D7
MPTTVSRILPRRALLRRALMAGLAALGLIGAGAPWSASAAPEAPGSSAPRTPVANAPKAPGSAAPRTPAADAPRTPAADAPKTPGGAAPKTPAAAAPKPPAADAPKAPATAAPKAPAPEAQRKPAGGRAPGAGAPARTAARAAEPPADVPLALSLPVERATLQNGLRVVLSADRSAPAVAVAVAYDAGFRDEPSGRSGVASLVAGMMGRGSRNVPPGGHLRLVTERGGELSTTVEADRTTYVEVMPASELALALWLEADRMRAPDLSAAGFEAQHREAQERRGAVLGAAYGQGAVRLGELVFQGYWPYEHPALGEADDVAGAELSWVREFHAAHYGPGNAVLTIVGDFDPGEAMALVRKHFDDIPAAAAAPFKDVPFPEQTSQRTAVVRDSAARVPAILYGWAVPPRAHRDHDALELAAVLLGQGESARLEALLVTDKAVAQSVRVSTRGHRGPDLFGIDVRLADGARVGDVEKLIEGEIRALATAGPAPAELAKARRLLQSAFVAGLADVGARARALGERELLFGDAAHLNGELARYFAVTREDVQRAVRDHLGPTRRTIVETYPPAAAEPARAPARVAAPQAGGAARAGAPAAQGKKAPAKARGGAARPAPKKKPTKPKKK